MVRLLQLTQLVYGVIARQAAVIDTAVYRVDALQAAVTDTAVYGEKAHRAAAIDTAVYGVKARQAAFIDTARQLCGVNACQAACRVSDLPFWPQRRSMTRTGYSCASRHRHCTRVPTSIQGHTLFS